MVPDGPVAREELVIHSREDLRAQVTTDNIIHVIVVLVNAVFVVRHLGEVGVPISVILNSCPCKHPSMSQSQYRIFHIKWILTLSALLQLQYSNTPKYS